MACQIATLWIRSHAVTDLLAIWLNGPRRGPLLAIQSRNGEFGWQNFGDAPTIGYKTGWITHTSSPRSPYDLDFNSIPYWSLALPLTLLSAYLILGKPRKPAAEAG
jgi:hypothetical protein